MAILFTAFISAAVVVFAYNAGFAKGKRSNSRLIRELKQANVFATECLEGESFEGFAADSFH